MKDPKRFLNDSEKAECLAAANYKCQGGDNCVDRDLANGHQFHHIKLHSEFGMTTRYNTQVLCLSCHKLAHRSSRNDLFTESGWDSLRQWQRDALDRFIESDGEHTFTLEAAPGAGKSRFAAFAAQYALSELDIDHVVFVAPWLPILTSVKKNFAPLGLEVRDNFHYDKKRGILQSVPGLHVTLSTYASLCNQTTVDVVKHWMERKNWSFMLILDEIHHTNTVSGKWGAFIERIASMAQKVVVMSGTYFRSDNRPISFLEYEGEKPKTDYSIGFAECVRQRFTRQVSFRFHDPKLEMVRTEDGKLFDRTLGNIQQGQSKMLAAAKQEVLNVNGVHVERMILDAWEDLQAMRRKWSDAACLIVCRAGTHGDEDRAIHAVESKVRSLTGQSPEVVTSDDATSRGRLESFANSADPFLCAIRMVSEGVDIPRIRMVLFLSFTDSEMLFRQIVGRCCRYIDGKEDDTAALVILPRFRVMAEFAERFEGESKQGALSLEPIVAGAGGDGPFEPQPCKKCGRRPCICYVILDSESHQSGGLISANAVDEEFIKRAKIIRDSSAAHQHANTVQLGDALQRSAMMGSLVVSDIKDRRRLALKMIEQKVRKIAKIAYGGDERACVIAEVHQRVGCDIPEIEGTWRVEKINELHGQLKARLAEVACNA